MMSQEERDPPFVAPLSMIATRGVMPFNRAGLLLWLEP